MIATEKTAVPAKAIARTKIFFAVTEFIDKFVSPV